MKIECLDISSNEYTDKSKLTSNGYGFDFKCPKSKRKGKYESESGHNYCESNPLSPVTNVRKYKYNYVIKGYNSKLVYIRIAPRGQTVENSLLNSRLQDVLSGLEVNSPDAHNDKIEEDEIQVNEICSDVNYDQAINEEIRDI
ncbi:Hypothetical predicted protein [Octopus vulgaris]|uniref:Uncharacterized protein n=1 Tax=Octopus vulgaris TaxID=6645 RepID=A0AA36AHN2_OCTVU|nr:Hypothetical predicted protein [Octopus vulgaris]